MKKLFLTLLVFVLGLSQLLPAYSLRTLNAGYELVLNVPTRKLLLFNRGVLEKEYMVGVGKSLTPTPIGHFKVVRRILNPAWVNPYRQSKVIESGASNPIGKYWLGFAMNKKNQEFGFHSTSNLDSLGEASTHGCVRLHPKEMEELYNLVSVGTPVHVIYNPIEVKEYENKLFVKVFPDIYNYMNEEMYLSFAKNQLSGANLVQEDNLYKAISNKDAKDYFIGWTGAKELNEQDEGITNKNSSIN